MTPSAVILIALLKTAGEGGTVQLPYADLATCEAAGATLQAQFEALPHHGTIAEGGPKVLYTCFETPVQP